MGTLALAYLGAEKEADHGFYVFPELGEGHPQTCMIDGIQVATGATYGKVMIAKTFYGKLAATFYHPHKGAVRYSLLPDFIDAMGKFVFRLPQKGHRAVADSPPCTARSHSVGLRSGG